jgi:hypothetical protein
LTQHFIAAGDNLARRWPDDGTPSSGEARAARLAGTERPLTHLRPVSIIDNR